MAKDNFKVVMNMDEVLESLSEFDSKYVNQHLRRGIVKISNAAIKPALKTAYGQNKVTGALMASPAVKGIYYKHSKTVMTMTGARTKNITVKRLKKKQTLFGVAEHFADKHVRKSLTMDKVEKAEFRQPGSGNPTRILTKKSKKGKESRAVYVRRDPSRYAHLVEKGHRLPGGGMTKSYPRVRQTERQVKPALQAALIREMHGRLTRAAAAALEKSK